MTSDEIEPETEKQKKCKHKWDYIYNKRRGEHTTAVMNPYYAMWICPYCDKVKYIKLNEGNI